MAVVILLLLTDGTCLFLETNMLIFMIQDKDNLGACIGGVGLFGLCASITISPALAPM